MFNRITGIVVAAVFAAGAANADNVTLRWGHYLGDSPFVQAEKDFASTVTERTEGRVNIEITFAGGLGALGSPLSVAILLLAAGRSYGARMAAEDKLLEGEFGDAWRNYAAATPWRLWPLVT